MSLLWKRRGLLLKIKRVLIVGDGSIGLGFCAGISTDAEVTVCSRKRSGISDFLVVDYSDSTKTRHQVHVADSDQIQNIKDLDIIFFCLKYHDLNRFNFSVFPKSKYVLNICNVPDAQVLFENAFPSSIVIRGLVYAQVSVENNVVSIFKAPVRVCIDQRFRDELEHSNFTDLFLEQKVSIEYTSNFEVESKLKLATTFGAHLVHLDRLSKNQCITDLKNFTDLIFRIVFSIPDGQPDADKLKLDLFSNISGLNQEFAPSGIKDILGGKSETEIHAIYRNLSKTAPEIPMVELKTYFFRIMGSSAGVQNHADDYRFPKGFSVKDGDDFHSEVKILSKLSEYSQRENLRFIRLPHINYFRLASKGASLLGEKVFELSDKKNRKLILNSDSLAPMLQYYSQQDTSVSEKYLWVSPTFRYRNIKSRFFSQIGISYLNFPTEAFGGHIRQCFENFVQMLCEVYPGCLVIKIWRPEKSCYLGDQAFDDLMEKLKVHFVNHDRVTLNFISGKIDSGEILSDIGFEFFTKEGQRVGDGGSYSTYASDFNRSIHTLLSFCSGIEGVARASHNLKTSYPL